MQTEKMQAKKMLRKRKNKFKKKRKWEHIKPFEIMSKPEFAYNLVDLQIMQ